MLNKVLILSASAGAGHIRAAEAIEKAIRLTNSAKEVRHLDVLKYTNKVFRNLYSKAYIDLVNNAPEVLGWLYDEFDKPWKNERIRLAFNKLNLRPFTKLLSGYQPDFTICTHFLPAEIISWMKGKEQLRSHLSVVVTDFDVHAMWLCRNFEHYFVALEETKVHLEQLGVAANKVTVSGIPIDPVFAETKDKIEMRRKHHFDPSLITILVSAGGFGVGPIENLIHSLRKIQHPVQVIAVCGRSEELKRKLEQLKTRAGGSEKVIMHILGYTTEMDELMSAADILIGKPGGLTTSEALAKGLAFVIVNPIPGQEERNSDHLLELGVAIRCNNLPALAYKVDALLEDKARLAGMQEKSRTISHPRAAYDIVEVLKRGNG